MTTGTSKFDPSGVFGLGTESNDRRRLVLHHGMKRSGNHVVSSWLLTGTNFGYINNMIPVGPILSGEKRFPDPVRFEEFVQQMGIRSGGVYVSLEDLSLDVVAFSDVQAATNVLIIRHPDSLFASRIQRAFLTDAHPYPRRNDAIMQRAVRLWKEHARCYLGQSTSLIGRFAIYYDEWLRNPSYRAEIRTRLHLSEGVNRPRTVTTYGGGSSFGDLRIVTAADKSAVLNRRKQLGPKEDRLLTEVYNDPEMTELKILIEDSDPFGLLKLSD